MSGFSRIPSVGNISNPTCSLWVCHETYFPTFRYPSQTHSRFPCAHEDPFGPRSPERTPRQGPQAPGRLSACVLLMADASFPPEARLHRPSEFGAALKGKRLARGALFIVSAAPLPQDACAPCARLGLVIAKRFAQRSVTRNAIKRVIREAFRATRPSLPAGDYVVRLNGKVAPVTLTHLKQAVRTEMDAHFARVCRS